MALEKITKVSGTAVLIAGKDIDTDRIIPARYLRCVTFDDLGEGLFYDERFTPDGESKGHPLDEPARAGAVIMVSGDNFGCGSSREHAPQAIRRAGFTAVIAGSFAEIFFGNATTIGLVCAAMADGPRAELAALVAARPDLTVEVDVARSEVRAAGRTFPVEIRASAREALVSGYWDPLGELLDGLDAVRAKAAELGHGPA